MNATEFLDPLSWCSAVMDYTHRGMTKALDRLVAIDGVASALGKGTEHQYMARLWSHDVCAGLLWSISHLKEFLSTTGDAFNLEEHTHTRHENSIALTGLGSP
jgi:hypothetical protein